MISKVFVHMASAEFRTIGAMARRTSGVDSATALTLVGETSASVREALQTIEAHSRLKSFSAWPSWLDRVVIAECVERLSATNKPKLPPACTAALTGALSVIARSVIPSRTVAESGSAASVAETLLSVACDIVSDVEDDSAQTELQVACASLWMDALYFCGRRCVASFKHPAVDDGSDLLPLFERIVKQGGDLVKSHVRRVREHGAGNVDMAIAKQIAHRVTRELSALSSIASKKTGEFIATGIGADGRSVNKYSLSVSLLHPFGKVEVERG
jgi:hypothetical protein